VLVCGTDVFWTKPGDDILAQTTRVNETTPACAYMIRATVRLGIGKWLVGYPIHLSDKRGGGVHRRLSFDHPMAIQYTYGAIFE